MNSQKAWAVVAVSVAEAAVADAFGGFSSLPLFLSTLFRVRFETYCNIVLSCLFSFTSFIFSDLFSLS